MASSEECGINGLMKTIERIGDNQYELNGRVLKSGDRLWVRVPLQEDERPYEGNGVVCTAFELGLVQEEDPNAKDLYIQPEGKAENYFPLGAFFLAILKIKGFGAIWLDELNN